MTISLELRLTSKTAVKKEAVYLSSLFAPQYRQPSCKQLESYTWDPISFLLKQKSAKVVFALFGQSF